jgi:ribonuclease HII
MVIMLLAPRFINDALIEIGIDEAGRGSFWGPIMAGAVILPSESEWNDDQKALFHILRDSKKISPLKREKIANQLKDLIPLYAVGRVDASEINEHGIQWSNREAFRRAVLSLPLPDHASCRLLIDGTLAIDSWKGIQEVIVEGDNQYMAIAAASILAKVEHDRWIQEYCLAHPECEDRYHLVSSKGYGTAKHREGIRIYGGHELHRNIYIQQWLPGATQTSKRKDKKDKKEKEEDICLIQFHLSND